MWLILVLAGLVGGPLVFGLLRRRRRWPSAYSSDSGYAQVSSGDGDSHHGLLHHWGDTNPGDGKGGDHGGSDYGGSSDSTSGDGGGGGGDGGGGGSD